MLIREIAGGEISSVIVDVYPDPKPSRIVEISCQNIDRLIGKTIHDQIIKNILTDLGFKILKETNHNALEPDGNTHNQDRNISLLVEIPAFKVDVTREADIIEEILRIYGYNNIEFQDEVRASLSFTAQPDPEKAQNLVSDYLVDNGFFEMFNNSLTKSGYYLNNPDFSEDSGVKVMNPISRDLDVMRQSLIYGALESISYNINRKTADLKFFEFGRIYSKVSTSRDPLPGYHEETHLAILVTGRIHAENWNLPGNVIDFFELKGYLNGIFSKLSVQNLSWAVEPFSSGLISSGLKYMVNDKLIATLGILEAQVAKSFDIRQPVFYADLNWDLLFSLIPSKNISFRGIPKFPEVRRDLAILVDQNVRFSQIESLAYRTEKKLLKQVGLFDVYEGDKIAPGKKSYALSFILRDDEKTMTDKEIERIMAKLLQAFAENLNAQLR